MFDCSDCHVIFGYLGWKWRRDFVNCLRDISDQVNQGAIRSYSFSVFTILIFDTVLAACR